MSVDRADRAARSCGNGLGFLIDSFVGRLSFDGDTFCSALLCSALLCFDLIFGERISAALRRMSSSTVVSISSSDIKRRTLLRNRSRNRSRLFQMLTCYTSSAGHRHRQSNHHIVFLLVQCPMSDIQSDIQPSNVRVSQHHRWIIPISIHPSGVLFQSITEQIAGHRFGFDFKIGEIQTGTGTGIGKRNRTKDKGHSYGNSDSLISSSNCGSIIVWCN